MRHPLPLLALCLVMGCTQRRAHLNSLPPDQGGDSVQVRLELVDVLLEQGRPDSALTLITTLRTEGIDTVALSVVEAQAMGATGMLTEASTILAEVVADHPDHGPAWAALGVIRLGAEDLEGALPALTQATTLLPHNPDVRNNLGFAQLAAGQHATAITTLREALHIAPSDPRIRTNLAYALVGDGQTVQALELFRADGSEADAQYHLGVGLEMGGHLDNARLAYTAAITANPQHQHSLEALDRLSPPPEVIP